MIKENIDSMRLGFNKFPKLKGHVKIELKNETTGKKEVVFEGDNMITNALYDIFSSNYCGALDYRKLLPLYSKMLGGILLFGNVQDVSSEGAADDYYIPDSSANTVIAHAGQTTFSSQADDITRGNPLDSAMHITDGAVTLAWTWGASAGNGTIKSVSLTHADVGDAGTGSTSEAFKALIPIIKASSDLLWTHTASNVNNMVFFVGVDGYGYRFTASGNTITLVKIPLAYKKTGLVADKPYNDGTLIETRSVTTTTSYSENPSYCYAEDTNKLWIFYSTSTGRTVKVEEISLSDWDIPNWHSTNHDSDFDNLDADVYALYNLHPSQQLSYSNGSVYFPKPRYGSTGVLVKGFLRVKLSSTANQTEYSANVVKIGGVFSTPDEHKVIVGDSYVFNNNALYPCSSNFEVTGTTAVNISRFPCLDQKVGLANLCSYYNHDNAGQSYFVEVSKFYLGSKFNLPEPVTKANNQSMTVTYTLTEV